MKKFIFIIAIALFGVTKVYADGVDDNLVCFQFGDVKNDLTIVSFTEYTPSGQSNWYSITPDQTWEGVLYASESNCLDVRASRKKSDTPEDYVESAIVWDPNNMYGAGWPPGTGNTSGELNFAFGISLTFNANGTEYKCSNIILGQEGNGAGENYWWMFSNNNNKNQSITCQDLSTGEQVALYPDDKSMTDNHMFGLYLESQTFID